MITHLYLARHGETDFNRQGIAQGRGVNTHLNDTGQDQAKALAKRFSSENIASIWSSPLHRAHETAQVIADKCGIETVKTDERLEEMSWGIHEGKPLDKKRLTEFERVKTAWQQGDYEATLEGGESLKKACDRAQLGLEHILNEEEGKRIIIIAHGRFLRIILAAILEEYGLQRMEELSHTNTCVNYLTYENKKFNINYLNCTKHLEKESTDSVSTL